MNSYNEALDYLYTQLPMFQRTGPAAYKHSLSNTLALDHYYGHPHRNYKTIHVAGTNGKGSVSHMLASILQESGYKTGLYTSPHLKDFRERIKINGVEVDERFVAEWTQGFMHKNEEWKLEPSFFELTVIMAFDYFSKNNVDVAVIEVGLGGRLDSTNIITPELSIITNIGYDHMNLLGDTLVKIAGEKAGIIKPVTPVVVGETHPDTKNVFMEKADGANSPIVFADQLYSSDYSMLSIDGKQILNVESNGVLVYPNLKTGLGGFYQRKNVATVLQSCDILKEKGWKITREDIYSGILEVVTLTGLRGRWQVIGHNPLTVCDTGHNEDGISWVVEQLKQTPFKKLHFVIGVVADKDMSRVLALLPTDARYYFTEANIPRALNVNELKTQASKFGLAGESYPTVSKALEAAKNKAQLEDMIFVGGSTFVVGEILP
jgi:dihydrofolate synthase/folylpolyglutamate synthase